MLTPDLSTSKNTQPRYTTIYIEKIQTHRVTHVINVISIKNPPKSTSQHTPLSHPQQSTEYSISTTKVISITSSIVSLRTTLFRKLRSLSVVAMDID